MINEYLLFNKDKSGFEKIYSVEDPWSLNNKQEQFRYKLTLNYIKKNLKKPHSKVLEFGCAEGNFTIHLSKCEYCVTAVDISDTAIDRARDKNISNAVFVSSDMNDYLLKNDIGKFDLILIMECIYYLSKENRIKFIENLRKKINPDAKVIISIPVNRDNEMFIPEKRLIKKMSNMGFGMYKDTNGIILSSKGKTGKLIEFIPSDTLKKFYFFLHKIFFPFRINQKLFLFRKD